MLAVGLAGDAAALGATCTTLNLPMLSSARASDRSVPILQPVPAAAVSSEPMPCRKRSRRARRH